MKIENRKTEILMNFKSCNKAAYYNNELRDELLELQREMVEMTFNSTHSELAGLKIWDVRNHLEDLNKEKKGIADDELSNFDVDCKALADEISATISGMKGENVTYQRLKTELTNACILRNVELDNGENHTELDLVVVNKTGITILEIKNTKKNVFIDPNGDYYRTGEYNRLDCNILGKLRLRKELLNDALERAGYSNIPIRTLIVFTQNKIEVTNKCQEIKTAFLCQVSSFIEKSDTNMEQRISDVVTVIKNSEKKKAFPMKLDAEKMKNDFAELMAKLENAELEEYPENRVNDNSHHDDISQNNQSRPKAEFHWLGVAGKVAAGIGFCAGAAAILKHFLNNNINKK